MILQTVRERAGGGAEGLAHQIGEVCRLAMLALGNLHEHTCYRILRCVSGSSTIWIYYLLHSKPKQ